MWTKPNSPPTPTTPVIILFILIIIIMILSLVVIMTAIQQVTFLQQYGKFTPITTITTTTMTTTFTTMLLVWCVGGRQFAGDGGWSLRMKRIWTFSMKTFCRWKRNSFTVHDFYFISLQQQKQQRWLRLQRGHHRLPAHLHCCLFKIPRRRGEKNGQRWMPAEMWRKIYGKLWKSCLKLTKNDEKSDQKNGGGARRNEVEKN